MVEQQVLTFCVPKSCKMWEMGEVRFSPFAKNPLVSTRKLRAPEKGPSRYGGAIYDRFSAQIKD
jgi:hypothetical protein